MSDVAKSAPAFYTAKTVKRICGVTARKLDYWIDTGVLQPARVSDPRVTGGRKTFLFSFENFVQVKTIVSLRDAGVSLQEIRRVIAHLRKSSGDSWQGRWILTDGRRVFSRTNEDMSGTLEELGSGGHQLAFAVVALHNLVDQVRTELSDSVDSPVSLAGRRTRKFKPSVDANASKAAPGR